ncbi:MAG: hypothetical protein IT324_27295 [Anaerolineae bacterium]|nr:hypothetical protein [Anaerolineae bacterium]
MDHLTPANRSAALPTVVRSIQHPGVIAEWLYEGQIVVFRLLDVSRSTIDDWSQLVLDAIAAIPEGQPVLFLHDGTSPKVGITPYLTSKVPGLYHACSHLPGRVAVVVASSTTGQLIALVTRTTYSRNARQTNRVFVDYNEAFGWLVQGLPANNADQ